MLLLLWNLMISKNKIKFLRSLQLKKHRDNHQKTILEGVRLITESLNFNSDWMVEFEFDFLSFLKNEQSLSVD